MLTTHYLEEAEELCDTVAIIDNGAVVACDKTDNLLRQVDNKTLIIRPGAQLETAPVIAGLQCTLRDDGQLAVQYNPGQQAAGEVLALVQNSGIEIADLASEGADLETVFMKLTGPSVL